MFTFWVTCALYFTIIIGIAIFAYRNTNQYQDYLLGGRRFGSMVTAMGVAASDMSGWLMLSLPGVFYLYGLNQIWIPIGLLIGSFFNWQFVGPRLRVYTKMAGNALTLPAFLQARLCEKKCSEIRVTSAVVFLIFFTCYAASGFLGAAKLVSNTFNIDYTTALMVSAPLVILYTTLGGYLAVNWIDLFQGFLMLFALVLLSTLIAMHLGQDPVILRGIDFNSSRFDIFHGISFITFISAIGWGLGYFGQPHILVRFMSSRDVKSIRLGKYVCLTWMFFAFASAGLIGLIGYYYTRYFPFGTLRSHEVIFLALTQNFFSPIFSALLFAAIISAIMSTVAAVLFAAASSLVEDGYHLFVRPNAQEKELIWAGRLMTLAISLFAFWIASLGENQTIFNLVGHAWSGLGAAFGPVILFSLFWSRISHCGGLLGMIMGGVVTMIWIYAGYVSSLPIFSLFELIPGFIAGVIGVILGSYIRPQKSNMILERHQVFLKELS